jgi:hypothetical protein
MIWRSGPRPERFFVAVAVSVTCGERPHARGYQPGVGFLAMAGGPMDFHSGVYKIMAGWAVWFVLGAWIFAGGGVTDLVLTIVTLFVLVAVGIPLLLGLTRRARLGHDEERGPQFGDWVSRDVHIQTGPLKGLSATVETMIPIASVAIGMTVFGLVVRFAGH